jgi:trehalose 6-phosphate phosphatase
MKHLLEAEGRQALARFARPDTLVALDYDGTLAPIVSRPADAAMRPSTRERLVRVARRFPVIVLTGRGRADALQHLDGVPVLEVIGCHGLETAGGATGRFLGRVERWRTYLSERLRALRGVAIEDKKYSLSVHYRQAADPAEALAQIERAAAGLEGARVVGGKAVVNFVPQEAPDKGRALAAACTRLGCTRAIYVGDDHTDEDVFALARADWLTVRVGESRHSAAAYYLREQAEIDALLDAVVGAAGRR